MLRGIVVASFIVWSVSVLGCAPTERVAQPLAPFTAPIDSAIQGIVKEKEVKTAGVKSKISLADEKQLRIPF